MCDAPYTTYIAWRCDLDEKIRVVLFLWGLLALIWGLASLYDVKPVVTSQSGGTRALQTGLLACSFFLLGRAAIGVSWLDQPLLSRTPWVSWAGVAFVGAGIVLAIWARTILGRNWSGVAVVKAGHDLITGGPYQIVRHPIYTGMLMAVLGTAVVRGTLHAMLAVPICLLSYWLKLQTEEDMLIRQFGHNYLQYRRRVKALIPYLL